MEAPDLVLGIDVGTASARAGLFDLLGRRLGHGSSPFETRRPEPEFVEQCSEEIWRACGEAARRALAEAAARPERVAGVGFDATSCSLVALDAAGLPVTVSPTGDDRCNVIVWMDQRAVREAERIDATGHEALRHVGGRISPEMAPPKLLWIKRHLPGSWGRTARFLDLTDFLSLRASGDETRSLCTSVCKWTYLGHEGRWPEDLFREVGLEDLLAPPPGAPARLRGAVEAPGTALGTGLTPQAARDLGLRPGTAVGVGIIDAHAGALGLLGAAAGGGAGGADLLERSLALIGGTSSCQLAVSRQPRFIGGIWGPYHSALIPGMWLTEGGQSATGSLIDCVIDDSAAAAEARRLARERGQTLYEVLNGEVLRLEATEPRGEITAGVHVQPDFHGNRSPWADPTLRGVVSGLSLQVSLPALARRYLAAIQAIAYGTRHIIETMNGAGYRIDTIHATGGGTRNPLWLREHADATGCRLVLPREPEAVLLGGAMLGAVAAGAHRGVLEAMAAMGGAERAIEPDLRRREFHLRKYRVFGRMHQHFLELRALMEG